MLPSEEQGTGCLRLTGMVYPDALCDLDDRCFAAMRLHAFQNPLPKV